MQSKKLSSLGMPTFFGKGSHESKGVTYRYLVMERFGKDVWSLFTEAGKSFQPATVFQLGLQMVKWYISLYLNLLIVWIYCFQEILPLATSDKIACSRTGLFYWIIQFILPHK